MHVNAYSTYLVFGSGGGGGVGGVVVFFDDFLHACVKW